MSHARSPLLGNFHHIRDTTRNGVAQSSGWLVDHNTGLVSFDTAPSDGIAITAGFEFDVPVRFDSDVLDVTLDIERLGSITSIPLLEIRR